MFLLRKNYVEGREHQLYSTTPPEVADHPLFSKGTVGIVTAEKPQFPTAAGGNASLSAEMQAMGLHHEPTHGSYGERVAAFLVHNPTREQMFRLGRKFGQESVVYSQDGRHEMLYTHGPNAGKAHGGLPQVHFSPNQPRDYYTHLPGRGYVTLHFTDELHDTPARGTMPMEMQTEMQGGTPLTKSEMRQILANVLRSWVQKHQK